MPTSNSNLVKRLIRWLKRLLGYRKLPSKVAILEEYHGTGVSVFRIADDNIPGLIDLWRIDRHHENCKFFVCLINLAHLREDLGRLRVGSDDLLRAHAGRLAGDLQQQIAEQSQYIATHLWITGWSLPYRGVDQHGRSYTSSRLAGVRILAGDFQGTAASFAGDRYAHYFARKIIKRLAANDFREYRHARTWQQAVKSIDWHEWLEGMTKARFGDSHVLQPPKSRLK